MQKGKDILDQQHTNARSLLQQLELLISEGLLSAVPAGSGLNLFGRPVQVFGAQDLGYLQGLANTGIRSAAILDKPADPDALQAMADRLLPGVIYQIAQAGRLSVPQNGSGWFQFSAESVESALDLGAIAHAVAEKALLPGLVHVPGQGTGALPASEWLRTFLGDPDEQIPSPTPAQELWFGKRRRRIPQWFNADLPVLQGSSRSDKQDLLKRASQQMYLQSHLKAIISEVFAEYGQLTGRMQSMLATYQTEKADFLLVNASLPFEELQKAVDLIRGQTKLRVGAVHLRVLHPFPMEELAASMKGKKGICFLEPLQSAEPMHSLLPQLRQAVDMIGKKTPGLQHGFLAGYPSETEWLEVGKNLQASDPKTTFFLDLAFTRSHSRMPRREVLLQTVKRAYPEAEALSLKPVPEKSEQEQEERPDLPLVVRQYQDQGAPYSRVSRFLNETEVFHPAEEALADPFQALPTVPPATAGLSGPANRYFIPTFFPDRCTGCGQCFVQCPHAAIPPIAIGLEKLIRSGMDMAAKQGKAITGFTPLVKNLTIFAGKLIKETPDQQWKVMDFLPEAFGMLIDQMDVDFEKEQAYSNDFYTLLDIIGDFPISITEDFFKKPAAQEAGSGELFSLAIDPVSCTGCGVCADVCPEEALFMEPETPSVVQRIKKQFNLWAQLPDTHSDTIMRLHDDPDYDSLAAILLSRNYYLSMTGANASEEGASAKTMLHLVTAVTESVYQPRLIAQLKEVDGLIEKLTGTIQSSLSNSLPKDNLDKLVENMEDVEGQKASLQELLKGFGTEDHLQLLDTDLLHRRIELKKDLETLQETLQSGPTGMGRARYGLVLAVDTLDWATQYPHHPFTVPVWIHEEQLGGASLVGMLTGMVRHWLDNLRLIRRARLEVKGKYHPEKDAEQIAALRWENLDEQEQKLLPPVLLVMDQQRLARVGVGELTDLLALGWPVKVVLLNDLQAPNAFSVGLDAALTAMTQGRAFVMQSSLATLPVLGSALLQGMDRLGSAVFHLLTPRQEKHIPLKKAWKQLPELALKSRAFPTFRYEPEKAVTFLSDGLDLSGNPDLSALWVAEEGRKDAYSFGDWLVSLQGLQDDFKTYEPESGAGVPLAEYVTLSAEKRAGKIPLVLFTDEAGDVGKKVASEKIIRAVEAVQRGWNALRDLAGQVNPHPEQLRSRLEQELGDHYQKEIDALKAEYEGRLAAQEAETKAKIKVQLREKLVQLAKARTQKVEE